MANFIHAWIQISLYPSPLLDPLEAVTVNRIGGPAILNESFTLHCEVNGTVESIQWWRNWQIIVPDNTTIIEANNRTLILNRIQRSDNGDYKCQAFNSVSNMTSSSFVVRVNCEYCGESVVTCNQFITKYLLRLLV